MPLFQGFKKQQIPQYTQKLQPIPEAVPFFCDDRSLLQLFLIVTGESDLLKYSSTYGGMCCLYLEFFNMCHMGFCFLK